MLQALRGWGEAYGRPAAPDDSVRASWLLKPLVRRPRTLPPGRVCELRVGDEVFHIRAGRDGVSVRGGAAEGPDAIVSLGLGELEALVSGSASASAIRAKAEVHGNDDAAGELLAALAPA